MATIWTDVFKMHLISGAFESDTKSAKYFSVEVSFRRLCVIVSLSAPWSETIPSNIANYCTPKFAVMVSPLKYSLFSSFSRSIDTFWVAFVICDRNVSQSEAGVLMVVIALLNSVIKLNNALNLLFLLHLSLGAAESKDVSQASNLATFFCILARIF